MTLHPERFASGHSFPQQTARNELEVELAWEFSVLAVKIGKSFEQLKRGLRKRWAALTTEALSDLPAVLKP